MINVVFHYSNIIEELFVTAVLGEYLCHCFKSNEGLHIRLRVSSVIQIITVDYNCFRDLEGLAKRTFRNAHGISVPSLNEHGGTVHCYLKSDVEKRYININ